MHRVKKFICIVFFISIGGISHAQEFPIAVGSDDTYGGGGAFDGTNFLIGIQGDAQSPYNITAQLVSITGNLTGSRISLGRAGSNPTIAFDGTNFLVVWTDVFPRFAGGDTNGIGNIYGQFISPAGNLVGTTFTFVSNVNIKFGQGRGGIAFHDTTYLLTYHKGGNTVDFLYGQRISRSGNLIGSPIQISSGYSRESAVAFDGTNYLMAWCKVNYPLVDNNIYGQFVSPSGALVGANFLIDGGQFATDNPVTMFFDGTRYWVAFHEQAADGSGRWNIRARFVTPAGAVAERFTVCDSSKSPMVAYAAFDGRNYLITWMEFAGLPRVVGRFFTPSGVPVDTAFTVFGPIGGKFPLGGVGGFTNGHYIVIVTRLDTAFANGDIYGLFLQPLPTGVGETTGNPAPREFALSQNYPNPFNPSTTIGFGIPEVGDQRSDVRGQRSEVTLRVYDVLGREVATLVNGVKQPGSYTVRWDAEGMPSGVYFYRLQAGTYSASKKLLLVR